ncbi:MULTISPECIES: vanadium-dependent haloperoxidase [Bradyrhizobium]|uniref:Phosphatase PAP2 family protein n=2 Tax=Bradyrhizobium quebecense TaxID=2748629 RepID=A0ABS3MGD6_9BRAD|nr:MULTISPECIES: vanadium-dependent haloperoxidase [Bradyrhizobium]UFX46496.1 phosphatase PAP2 family protein [Bradyrhizobium sp. 41S5]UGY05702.1 phosphatase PAP2 family protein [Bradyrhizobium quebecense]
MAKAQTSGGANELRDIFAIPNYRAPSPNLQFLKGAQEQRIAAPREPGAFLNYLTRLPLVQKITTGVGPDLYHLLQWNAFALDLTAQDHTTLATSSGVDPLYAEQFGPHRSSRALAIIHLAVFEAVNTIYRRAQSYKGVQAKIFSAIGRAPKDVDETKASVRSAIAVAAHDTMVVLYPNKTPLIEAHYRQLVPTIPDNPEMQGLGSAIGEAAATQILALRKYDPSTKQFGDGSETDGKVPLKKGPNNSLDLEPTAAALFPNPQIDDWRVDPITGIPKAIGGYWSYVEPFVIDPKQLFLPGDPPKSGTPEFQKSYDDVRALGGDPSPVTLGARHATHTSRTGTSDHDPLDEKNETFKGNYWAYDGTALLCAPPRMYNMIATSIALNEHPISDVAEMARYLALVNLVLADCGIGSWTAKYEYHLARPVTWIRLHDPDKSVDGTLNHNWTPLGAPADNASPTSANLTPPFPAYPSGHAVFGGGLFQTLRKFHGDLKFSFVSDEYNGLNRGPTGETRPRVERTFQSLTEAEKENGRSRIWLGIHWQFDADNGIKQGNAIADYVLANALQRV